MFPSRRLALKLREALYGLKQSGHHQSVLFRNNFIKSGFKRRINWHTSLEATLNEVSMMLITEKNRPGKPFTLRFLANVLGYEMRRVQYRNPGIPGFLYCIRVLISYSSSLARNRRVSNGKNRMIQIYYRHSLTHSILFRQLSQ